MSTSKLAAVLRFVRSHSPGYDAYIDEQHNVVRWSCPAVVVQTGEVISVPCAASNFAEAREELGY